MEVLGDTPTATGPARARAREIVRSAPVRRVMKLAAESALPSEVETVLAEAILQARGVAVVERAATEGRRTWERIAALRVLSAARREAAWVPLRDALVTGRPEVGNAVIGMLGQHPDPRAATLLAEALQFGRHSRSRIATALESFPREVPEIIAPLMDAKDEQVRYWSVQLMRRYPDAPGLGTRLLALTNDASAFVRKAALDTLTAVRTTGTVAAARRCLGDEIPYVRAQAARTLGALGGPDSTQALLPLLADRDWWVRYAAKHSLEMIGGDVEAALLDTLSHDDSFARNGAAEVLQNLGTFERFLMREAAGTPSPAGIEMLKRLAHAGGARMWASALARLGAADQERARMLLADIVVDFTSPLPLEPRS